MAGFVDLMIVDQDLVPDSAGEPGLISGLASIAQDLRHSIMESGHLLSLIGERNPQRRELVLQQVEILVDEDVRLIAGSTSVSEISTDKFLIKAESANKEIVEIML